MLELEAVCKTYGEGAASHEALHDVSMRVGRGEFVALMGPSGCGKSTLLHIAGAMDRVTSGAALLGEKALNSLSDQDLARVRRQQVGFVFQAFNLLPTLTVQENICLPLTLDRMADHEAAARAGGALGRVGLANKSGCYPSQLSGGEMQRVAIARAVAIEPDLLIADEPTGSLDSENGARVLDLLAELNQSLGITILMATHSEEAAALAGRRITMRDGRLQSARDADALSATL